MSPPPILAELESQAAMCERLGSPFTARLLRLVAADLPPGPLGRRLRAWEGDRPGACDAMALRLAGALHRLARSGDAPALGAAYPPHEAGDLREALREAVRDHGATLAAALDAPPQTNEVGRAAVLIAAAHHLAGLIPLPLRLSELGASAGLNLNLDRFALEAGGARLGPARAALTLRPEWRGPVPAPAPVRVEERRGVDLAPVDLEDPEARTRLRSFVWADQADRLARLDAALALPPAPVDRDDVARWLPRRLGAGWEGQWHLVYHSFAWQYFPEATADALRAALEAAGARATATAPLAWLGYEGDGRQPGSAVTLRVWPGDGAPREIARADAHGRWVEWAA